MQKVTREALPVCRPGQTREAGRLVGGIKLPDIVTVASEARFILTPDGVAWTQHVVGDSFWRRYLSGFREVAILARCSAAQLPPRGATRLSDPTIRLIPLPPLRGADLPLQAVRLARILARNVHPASAYVLRIPGLVGAATRSALRMRRIPFGVEVLGDPDDAFAPGAFHSPLRGALRRLFRRELRVSCAQAVVSSYVTEQALQAKYPSSRSAFTTHYSDVELPSRLITRNIREISTEGLNLVTVGSMEHSYKGIDTLLDAVALLTGTGHDIRLTIIGDGRCRPTFELRAAELGITSRVTFAGHLARDAVLDQIGRHDLFVLASRQEGLPRAMIEAMAVGRPCIGTTVGGVPELLEPEDMVPPNRPTELADKLRVVSRDPERIRRMVERNRTRAARYSDGSNQARRAAFLAELQQRTARITTSERVGAQS
jgi:glycosyltransferase involved in cell wall biosynthesis